jgi:hypothetical protein
MVGSRIAKKEQYKGEAKQRKMYRASGGFFGCIPKRMR